MSGLRPTSPDQFLASAEKRLAPIEQIRDSVLAVPLAMAGGFLPYSITYLLRDADGGLHVIDPGMSTPENHDRLLTAIDHWGGAARSVIVTHLHPDHLGLADELRSTTGAPIVMHELEQVAMAQEAAAYVGDPVSHIPLDRWGVPDERRHEFEWLRSGIGRMPELIADRAVAGPSSLLDIPGLTAEAIHTPGHTAGHIVLRLPDLGMLLTGDHVLPQIHPGLGLGGTTGRNAVSDYLESLDAVRGFDDLEVLPGHGFRFFGLEARCEALRAHHLRRAGEVASALRERPDAVTWDVASAVSWTAGWSRMQGYFLLSALKQTEMYVDFVRPSGRRRD